MREESLTAISQLPAEVLWDYLADYRNVLRLGWEEEAATRLEDSPGGTVRFRARALWEGVPSTYTALLEPADRPCTLTWLTRSGGSKTWVRFDLRPLDEASTEVRVTLHLEHGTAVRPFEPLAWALLKPRLQRTVMSLERLHEEIFTAG